MLAGSRAACELLCAYFRCLPISVSAEAACSFVHEMNATLRVILHLFTQCSLAPWTRQVLSFYWLQRVVSSTYSVCDKCVRK